MWLVLDCPFLCYRVARSRNPLTVEEGFFNTLSMLCERFQPDRLVFCWDHRHLWRREYFKGYKRRAEAENPEAEQIRQRAWDAMEALRTVHLKSIGFQNIFYGRGLESDDWMARVARTAQEAREEMVIVTSDSDLYQVLGSCVSIYNPNQPDLLVTAKVFKERYGISPRQWPMVKAIGGCASDNVPGPGGVAEKTAVRFLTGELPAGSAKDLVIRKFLLSPEYQRNLWLVKLPWEGSWMKLVPKEDKLVRSELKRWHLRIR